MPPDDYEDSKGLGDELEQEFIKKEAKEPRDDSKKDGGREGQNMYVREMSKDSNLMSIDPLRSGDQPPNSKEKLRYTVPEVEEEMGEPEDPDIDNNASNGRFLIEEYQGPADDDCQLEKDITPQKKIVLKRKLPPIKPSECSPQPVQRSPNNLSFNGLSQSVSEEMFKPANNRIGMKRKLTEANDDKDIDLEDRNEDIKPPVNQVSREPADNFSVKIPKKNMRPPKG